MKIKMSDNHWIIGLLFGILGICCFCLTVTYREAEKQSISYYCLEEKECKIKCFEVELKERVECFSSCRKGEM